MPLCNTFLRSKRAGGNGGLPRLIGGVSRPETTIQPTFARRSSAHEIYDLLTHLFVAGWRATHSSSTVAQRH